jgi:hypothetical protein
MIDRTQLDTERATGQIRSYRCKAGHAQDHGIQLRGCGSGRISGKVNEIFTLCAGLQRM